MGIFSRRPPAPVEVVTASSRKVELTTDQERGAAEKRRESWKERAWEFVDQLGEAHEAARYYADAMSRLTLFGGIRPDPQADPVPLEPEGNPELGYSALEAATVAEALERLRSPVGGHDEIMRRLGLLLFVPGDAYLCGREDDSGERFDIYSTDELQPSRERSDQWVLVDPEIGPGGTGSGGMLLAPETTTVSRIWRQHGRYSSWSDSPMRSALGILDELLIHTKAMRAVALSRVAGPGLLFLPNSMRKKKSGNEADPQTDGQSVGPDPVVTDLVEATAAAITDPSSAAGQVPVVAWVDDDVYEKISSEKLIQWDRSIDETMANQRAELRERFAVAIDLPAEVLTGKAGLNDWGAWNIDRQVFVNHLAPGAGLATTGLTNAYLTPYLAEARVVDPARFVLGYDPSRLVQTGDPLTNAREAHDRILISDVATRRELGYTEDDAPTPEEIAERTERARARRGATPGTDAPKGPDTPPDETTSESGDSAVTAAVSDDDEVAGLTDDLAAIDAGLLSTIHQVADAAMRRALERADNRLASLACKDEGARGGMSRREIQEMAARDPLSVAPTLGPTLVTRLAAGTDLFDGAWTSLHTTYTSRTSRAAEEVIALALTRGSLTEGQASAIRNRLAHDRDEGWAVLLTALGALAIERLFRPLVDPGQGEFDGSLVPPGTVRDALIRAGGGTGAERAASMLTGETFMDLWRQSGITFEGWVWRYGDPSARTNPFEPHRERDTGRTGNVYTGPDDPRLQSQSWPYSLWPDDHKGCMCTMARATARRAGASTLPGELQEAAA